MRSALLTAVFENTVVFLFCELLLSTYMRFVILSSFSKEQNIRGFRQRRTDLRSELKKWQSSFRLMPKADQPLAEKADQPMAWAVMNKTYTVYVLRSLINQKRYVGYTSKSVDERLHEHLSGTNQWTRQNGPFVLIHTESFIDKPSAIRREHFLKSGQGRCWLDENIRG